MSAYWNNKGRFQADYDLLFNELVPMSGNCETLAGEAIRSATRLYYDAFNNGFCNNTSGAHNFLKTYIAPAVKNDDFDSALAFVYPKTNNSGYSKVCFLTEAALDTIVDTVVQYALSVEATPEASPCDLFDLQDADAPYEEEDEDDYEYDE